jgi:polyisoprenoid-binding protein YceI
MVTLDAAAVRCFVLTYKEGLLSAVAHDLKLEVTRLSLDVGEAAGSVRATFDAASLRVVCAVKDGVDAPRTLRDKDKRDIVESIEKDVLGAKRHPQVRFVSSRVERDGEGYRVAGRLELKGASRELSFPIRSVGADWVCEVRLHQPDYGIKPFSAMLGAMKVKPDVDVRVTVPKAALER